MKRAYLEIRREGAPVLVNLNGNLLTIGRERTNEVSFPLDEMVSRKHAVLERLEHGWYLRDTGSLNGTYINGKRITSQYLLRPGDEITVGTSRIMFLAHKGGTDPPPVSEQPPTASYLNLSEEWGSQPSSPTSAPQATSSTARPSERSLSETDPCHEVTPPASAILEPKTPNSQARQGPAHISGVARGVQVRWSEKESQDILVFRVDRYDDLGNRLDPIGVEFRRYKGGQLGEGENVEVMGRWLRGTVVADKIFNRSTHAEIRGPGTSDKIVLLFAIAFFALIVAWIAYVGYMGFFGRG